MSAFGTEGAFGTIGGALLNIATPVASQLLGNALGANKKPKAEKQKAPVVQLVAPQTPSPVVAPAAGGIPTWGLVLAGVGGLIVVGGLIFVVARR